MTNKTDEELIRLYKEENLLIAQEVLFERYLKVANKLARSYFLVGGDKDDLVQVAVLGIFHAVNYYNGSIPFKNYAYKVAKNAILSEIKKSQSGKNKPLLNYLSFSESEDKTKIIVDTRPAPEEEMISQDTVEEIHMAIQNNLSKFEYNVLRHFISGKSYMEIATLMNKKDEKSIDNAIQRARRKLYTALNDNVNL